MDCDTFLDEEKVAVVVQVTSVEAEATVSNAMFALHFSTLVLNCVTKRLGNSPLG